MSRPENRSYITSPFITLYWDYDAVAAPNLIGFTPDLRARPLEIFQRYRSGPVYTPPSVEGTIVNPGWAGGGNWNGAAFDPETQYLYIPSYSDYTVVELRRPEPGTSDFDYMWGGAQTPTVDGLPIFKPPWGRTRQPNDVYV